jgi:hypothetical protein
MIPEDGTIDHIMWALFFMRAYPKEEPRTVARYAAAPTTMGAETTS